MSIKLFLKVVKLYFQANITDSGQEKKKTKKIALGLNIWKVHGIQVQW